MVGVNPYLNFNGNTEEAFKFYKSVFGGEFMVLQRFRDMPGAENIPPDAKDKIMHIALRVGENILMATDALESLGQKVNPGTNVYLCLNPDSKEEADRVFDKLSAGGKVEMPLADQFWGDYFGSLTDKFGINWMIAFSPNRPQK